VVFAVPAWAAWRMEPEVWPFLVASGALQLVYFALLVSAYRVAPLSVVYPISRGVAPVLVLLLGVAVLGHATSVGQVLGVLLVAAGVLLVRVGRARRRGRRRCRDRAALADVARACSQVATSTSVQSSRCTSASSCSSSSPSNSATARSYFSIAQPQKSKSRSEIPSWIEPQSV